MAIITTHSTPETMSRAELIDLCYARSMKIKNLEKLIETYDGCEAALCSIIELCRIQLRDAANLDEYTVALLETIRDRANGKLTGAEK